MAKFQAKMFGLGNFLGLKNLVAFLRIAIPKSSLMMLKNFLRAKNIFSSQQNSYLLLLVPEKALSSSWQNKKLRTQWTFLQTRLHNFFIFGNCHTKTQAVFLYFATTDKIAKRTNLTASNFYRQTLISNHDASRHDLMAIK